MKTRAGFSLLEVIMSLGIFSLIMGGIILVQISIFRGNKISEIRSNIDQRSIIVLRNFASDVRIAQIPYDGSFAIASTTEDTVAFFSDINGDNIIERIRYFVEDGAFKRGVIVPSGQPLIYDLANETVVSLIQNILTLPPYFIFYGASFDGATSTPSLLQPVSPFDVRLVELNLSIATKIQHQPIRTLQTRAAIRSLKNK